MAEASTQCGEVLHSSTRWHVRHGPKEYIILLYAVIVWLGGRSHWKRGSVSSLSLNPTVLILTFFFLYGDTRVQAWPTEQFKKTDSRQETGSHSSQATAFIYLPFEHEPTWISTHPLLFKYTVQQIPPISGGILSSNLLFLALWQFSLRTDEDSPSTSSSTWIRYSANLVHQ